MTAKIDINENPIQRGYLRAEGVLNMIPISKRTLMRWQKQGRLPHIKASPGVVLYRVADIEKMLANMTINAI